jgi:glycosyltransferase involved in cell wall biosynthesis
MKKVALLTNFIPPYRIPLFRALSAQVDHLQIMINTPMEPNRTWAVQWSGMNVTLLKSWMFSYRWKHQQGFQEKMYFHIPYNLLNELNRFSPDVIVSSEMGARTVQAVLYKMLHRRVKLVVWATLSEYTEIGRARWRKTLRAWILNHTDAVVVNGESGARYIAQFGVAPEAIIRMPGIIDPSGFSEFDKNDLDLSQVDRRILYVGSLEPRKGLLPFLRCLTDWCQKHPWRMIEFWLAGEGSLANEIQSFERPRNLNLRLLGNVPYASLPQVYHQAHVFAFPSLADEWGMVISEAMAARLPVLGSIYSQAVEELVADGETGWVFHPDDENEMYTKLDQSLNASNQQLNQFGSRAQAIIRQQTPEYAAAQMRKAIQAALTAS